ncbi:MAG: hypothetical protein K9J38_02095 [Polynucleobacter sp.]|nr:hypothetical protein [Polynucleobacter sp.]
MSRRYKAPHLNRKYENIPCTLNLLLAPTGTPYSIIQKFNQAFVKVLNQTELKNRFSERCVDLVSSSPEDMDKLIKSEVTRQQKLAKNLGIKPD